MYKHYRNKANLTIDSASEMLCIAPRTLSAYEAGKIKPSPDMAVSMGEVYGAPQLTAQYCRQECAIGQRYCFDILNNVDLSPVAILTKFIDEKSEIDQMLSRLMTVVLNKRSGADFTEAEMADFKFAVLELLDLEHVIETLKLQIWRFCDVGELVREHNQKCVAQGYYKDKAPRQRCS